LRRHQYWWFFHVLLDLIKSLLLFITPYKLLILLDPQQWRERQMHRTIGSAGRKGNSLVFPFFLEKKNGIAEKAVV
jgi:hypothetical protein